MSKIGVIFLLLSISAFSQSSGVVHRRNAAQAKIVQLPGWSSPFELQDHRTLPPHFGMNQQEPGFVVEYFQWSPHTTCSIPLQQPSIPADRDFAIRQTTPQSDGKMRFVDPPAPVCAETPSVLFLVPAVPEQPHR